MYLYYFHLTPWTVPAHHSWVAGGTADSDAVQYEHATPSRVVRPIAILIDGYERVFCTYGSLFGLILLTGLGGVLGDPDPAAPAAPDPPGGRPLRREHAAPEPALEQPDDDLTSQVPGQFG